MQEREEERKERREEGERETNESKGGEGRRREWKVPRCIFKCFLE